MKFRKIKYADLNNKQKEIFNFKRLRENFPTTDTTASNLRMTGKERTFSRITKMAAIR